MLFRSVALCLTGQLKLLIRYAVVLFNMVWPCPCEGKFCFSRLTYCDSEMIFQFFCLLFVVMHYDVDGCLNLGLSEIITTCIW